MARDDRTRQQYLEHHEQSGGTSEVAGVETAEIAAGTTRRGAA